MRAVAFGDQRAGFWGAAFSAHPDLPSFVIFAGEPATVVSVEIAADSSGEGDWRIAGEGLQLTVAGEGARPDHPSADFDQLVTVRGRLQGDQAREVECRGCRSERAEAVEPGRFALIRDACAWFAPGDGFAFVAVRPRRASGHGDEHVSATVFSAGHALSVAEPRLSTAYNEEGQPTRATLELWLEGDDEPAEPGQEEVVQYPRRAAGEAAGPAADHEFDKLALGVQPFRWRAEGREGAGVYLLARAR
ncbi:MAG TPA: hypothetical protein VFB39_07035 [Solirubrobacteraceae bacterium]|nr:hypothetical protein [Solirubrobacteraceae bacterium]